MSSLPSQKIRHGNSENKRTPMSTIILLDKDEHGKSIDQKVYQSIIGSLLYITASRADIMFCVHLCTRY